MISSLPKWFVQDEELQSDLKAIGPKKRNTSKPAILYLESSIPSQKCRIHAQVTFCVALARMHSIKWFDWKKTGRIPITTTENPVPILVAKANPTQASHGPNSKISFRASALRSNMKARKLLAETGRSQTSIPHNQVCHCLSWNSPKPLKLD